MLPNVRPDRKITHPLGQDSLMTSAELAVQGAREAAQRGLLMYQCWLQIWDDKWIRPSGNDDPNVALSEIAAFGWELVSSHLLQYPGTVVLDCMYVSRRVDR
jgi:hypothetical protein